MQQYLICGTVQIWTEPDSFFGRLNTISFTIQLSDNKGTACFPDGHINQIGARAQNLSFSGIVTSRLFENTLEIYGDRFVIKLKKNIDDWEGRIEINYPKYHCTLRGEKVLCQVLEIG